MRYQDAAHLTVLIVDDSQHFRRILRLVLRNLGVLKVVEAMDGAAAFECLKTDLVDIIITDLEMAPVDGISFTRQVRNIEISPQPFVPIIMLTGHTQREWIVEARDAGVSELLAKPLTPLSLKRRIESVVKNPRSFVQIGQQCLPDRRRQEKSFVGNDLRGSIRPETTDQTDKK